MQRTARSSRTRQSALPMSIPEVSASKAAIVYTTAMATTLSRQLVASTIATNASALQSHLVLQV